MLDTRPRESEAVRVLFVDDSRLIRFAGQRFLREEFDVVFAENGRQAWETIQADPSIRMVMTDLMMPEMDGVALIRRIRGSSIERIRNLPVLVVTSVEERAGRRRAMDAGATDLVPKPFSGTDLVHPARQYLRRPGRRTQAPRPAMLPNIEKQRWAFVNRLEQAASFHDRHRLEYSMLHVRLDNYREIARRFGLNWAESMMRHVERELARSVRVEDTIGRSANAVFSVLLMATPEGGARRLGARLRYRLGQAPVRFPGRTLELKVSLLTQNPALEPEQGAEAVLESGLERLARPANVTRLTDHAMA